MDALQAKFEGLVREAEVQLLEATIDHLRSEMLGILFSEFCPSACLKLVTYLRRCLNPSLLVGDPLVFLLLCILMMESLPADRY